MGYLKSGLLIGAVFSLSLAAQEPGDESTGSPDTPPVIKALSQAELDAEMERVQQALGETDEIKEFIPTKPLAADLPIALPSDI